MHDAESASSVMPLQQTSATALVTDGNRHGEASHVNNAKNPREKAAVALLAAYLVPQATVHDAESTISHTPLPKTSAAALVTESNEHGEGSHVKDAQIPSERAAVALLAVHPVCQATVHDAESAILVTLLPQTSAAALVTEGNEHREGSQVKEAIQIQVNELLSRCCLYIPCRKPPRTTLSQQSRSPQCRKFPQLRWLPKATNTGNDHT